MATFIRVPRIDTDDTNAYTLSLHDVPTSTTQATLALHSVAVQLTQNLQREMLAEITNAPSSLTFGDIYAVEVVRDSDGFVYASGYVIYRDGDESPCYSSLSSLNDSLAVLSAQAEILASLEDTFKDGDIQHAQELNPSGDDIPGSFVTARVTKS